MFIGVTLCGWERIQIPDEFQNIISFSVLLVTLLDLLTKLINNREVGRAEGTSLLQTVVLLAYFAYMISLTDALLFDFFMLSELSSSAALIASVLIFLLSPYFTS